MNAPDGLVAISVVRHATPASPEAAARAAAPSARRTCATTGARLPSRRASIVSGEPAWMRAFPGTTSSATREGNSASDTASNDRRAVSRPKNPIAARSSTAAAARSPARRRVRPGTTAAGSMDETRRAASATMGAASAGRASPSGDAARSTALARRSSSDGSVSSMKRATRASDGISRAGHRPHTIAPAASASAIRAIAASAIGDRVVQYVRNSATASTPDTASDARAAAWKAMSRRQRARTRASRTRIWR